MLFTDADFSSPIYEADKLFAGAEGADVAIGSRWLRASCRPNASPGIASSMDGYSTSRCITLD